LLVLSFTFPYLVAQATRNTHLIPPHARTGSHRRLVSPSIGRIPLDVKSPSPSHRPSNTTNTTAMASLSKAKATAQANDDFVVSGWFDL
jgi:hypothetical protein